MHSHRCSSSSKRSISIPVKSPRETTLPPPRMKTGFLYRYLAHPMYVGVLLGAWATPHMSMGHLLLALGLTARERMSPFPQPCRRDQAPALGPDEPTPPPDISNVENPPISIPVSWTTSTTPDLRNSRNGTLATST